MNGGYSFEPRNQAPCETCGLPLPCKRVYRIVRDDSDPAVIALVMDGSINGLVCPNDGYRGWVAVPLLWVDRRKKRAVFVAPQFFPDDEIRKELRELSALALHDVSPADRSTILGRLQQVQFPPEIAVELERPVEDAERSQIAYQAFRRRELLPRAERLERLIDDVLASGALHCDGREVTPEFLALAERALAEIGDQRNSRRAEILRALVSNIAQRVRRDPGNALEVPDVKRGPDVDSAKLTESLLRFYRPPAGDPVAAIASDHSDAPVPDFAQLASAAATAKNPSERIAALRTLLLAYFGAELLDETSATARQLIDLAAGNDAPHDHAGALVVMGAVEARRGDANSAMSYLALADDAMRKLPAVNPLLLAVAEEAIGDAQMLFRNFPEAEEHYKRASERYEEAELPGEVRRVSNRLAAAYFDAGHRNESIAVHRRILEQSDELSFDSVRSRLNLGIALFAVAEPPTRTYDVLWMREPDSDRATQTEQRLDAPPAVPPGLRARVEVSTQSADGQKQFLFESIIGDEAIDQLARARREAIAIGAHDLELSCYTAMANAYLNYRMRIAARDILQLAIKRHQELGRAIRPHTLSTLASVWEAAARHAWHAGNFDEARGAWTEALALFKAAADGCRPGERIGSVKKILAASADGQALCLEALGRHAEARKSYRDALGMFEGVRQYLLERDQKEHIQRDSMRIFSRAQRNTLSLYATTGDAALLEEAFYFAEAGRSRILLDEIGAFGVARPVALEKIAGSLPDGTALLHYSLVPPDANCPGSLTIYVVAPQSGLAAFIVQQDPAHVLSACAAIDRIIGELNVELSEEREALDGALETLGGLLLPQRLIDFLRERGTECIIFSPEGSLFDVPFAALRVPWNGSVDDLCRAGIRTVVVPSASTYIAANERRIEIDEPSLLCVSDPQEDLEVVSQWVDERIRTAWPGPSVHLSMQAATRDNVLHALPRSRVVFYFGHGEYRQEDVTRSGLLLHDEVLAMRDITSGGLKLECDLFLALACFGARVDADFRSREILGFSAALLQAGARNVVGGLWPLRVGFAKAFGAALMHHTLEGTPVAEACRRALNEARAADARWDHPYYWGGVRLIGTGI